MKPGEISRTARLVAACRAIETAGARKLCDDPYASFFAGDVPRPDERLITGIALRTRFLDEAIVAFGRAHAGLQIVLCGAGLDARAVRLRPPGAVYFELDLPDMLEHKRQVFAAHEIRWDAHTVPLDLNAPEPLQALAAHPAFDRARPTCVVWEGVSYYLPQPTVDGILHQIVALLPDGERGLFLFDYVRTRWITAASAKSVEMVEQVARWGEPLVSGIDDLPAALRPHGLEVLENVATEDLLPRYGQPAVEKRWYAASMAVARRG